ncbi:hypothetical protein SODALDRAFT_359321 [Sodiomyces alkalinus F11]|uniref:Uncharacterized protein n=1 Tax=Sodiomyces alkalinus (strain CBS 110278 / VKM F-3762 / F11) TaxID=1314773 RepID=A0A3N2PY00_SODAK|nr:hypothetical protein SODALDRAFT_359321 [Sodiomyces alkalinus F11]ROT39413.1 hypothetical protein SODALDRAFT_359321 [Sodiomyces alkalinus F11]
MRNNTSLTLRTDEICGTTIDGQRFTGNDLLPQPPTALLNKIRRSTRDSGAAEGSLRLYPPRTPVVTQTPIHFLKP